MGETTFGEGSWIFGLIVLLGLFGGFGGGFGGNNAAMAGFATTAEVQNSINSAFAQQNAQNILLSSANNNYETARLISDHNMAMMNQSNSNLINAIQGYNSLGATVQNGFSSVNQSIANLGYKMDECCCSIKTMLLENRLQDTQLALQDAQNKAVNAEQSAYLLNVMGKWVANAPAAAGA